VVRVNELNDGLAPRSETQEGLVKLWSNYRAITCWNVFFPRTVCDLRISAGPWRPSFSPRKDRSRLPACGSLLSCHSFPISEFPSCAASSRSRRVSTLICRTFYRQKIFLLPLE
jgi:hypothetical protein